MGVKYMISQPMRDKSDQAILFERATVVQRVEKEMGFELELIDTFFQGGLNDMPDRADPSMYCLGESIKMMSEADILVLAPGWKDARGCVIECEIAALYGLRIVDCETEYGMKEGVR